MTDVDEVDLQDELPVEAPEAVVEALRSAFAERRKLLGYGQRRVARAMGVTQSVVSDLENGRTANPGLGTLTRWAAALQADLTVSVTFAPVMIPAHTKTIRLADARG